MVQAKTWFCTVQGHDIQLFHFSNILLLLTSHQSLFITLQIKKSLQNKIFHFSIPNILTFLLCKKKKKKSYFFSHLSIFAIVRNRNRNKIVYQTNQKRLQYMKLVLQELGMIFLYYCVSSYFELARIVCTKYLSFICVFECAVCKIAKVR